MFLLLWVWEILTINGFRSDLTERADRVSDFDGGTVPQQNTRQNARYWRSNLERIVVCFDLHQRLIKRDGIAGALEPSSDIKPRFAIGYRRHSYIDDHLVSP